MSHVLIHCEHERPMLWFFERFNLVQAQPELVNIFPTSTSISLWFHLTMSSAKVQFPHFLCMIVQAKWKIFWSLNHFHVNTGWDKPGPAESWCSPVSIPVERTQVAKCFSHRFVRWTVRQIYRRPERGSTEGNTELPLCWPVKAGAYIQIYIYIYKDIHE